MRSAILAIAPLGLLGVALTSTSWWGAFFSLVGVLVPLGLLREWSLDQYPPRAVFALVITGGAYLYGAFLENSPISFVPFSLAGALLLMRLKRRRLLAMLGFSVGVAALGAAALLGDPPTWMLVLTFVVIPFAGTLFIGEVIFVSERGWMLVRGLERAKAAEFALAVAEERARFAADLHDIQGQSLQVIKLKAALAQRVVRADPDRAGEELQQIRGLVDDTVAKTRELAYARYEIDLAAELENARALCEAAGMQVEVRGGTDLGPRPHPLLAHVLREATTNLLRHANPKRVTITALPGHVEVTNDGALAEGPVALRGLDRLRQRIREAGGELEVRQDGDIFTVSATLSQPRVPSSGHAIMKGAR